MSEAQIIPLFFLAGLSAWAATGLVLRHAVANLILDVPNDRSSHTVPTPRGGGIAIVIVTVASITLGTAAHIIPLKLAIAVCGGGVAVALTGWADDKSSLSPWLRLGIQLAAAMWGTIWLGGMPTIQLPGFEINLGFFGSALAVVGIVWSTNLFNFMDGIDGLASAEAMSVGFAAAILLVARNEPSMAIIPGLLAATSAGFAVWNWPPAKIFMGDVGSNFLGYSFGILAVASENAHTLAAVNWAILGSVFVFDATVTLVRRIFRGEAWHSAHRMHAYQRAVLAGYTHAQVTLSVLAINAIMAALLFWYLLRPIGYWPIAVVVTMCLVTPYLYVERLYPLSRYAPHRTASFE